MKLELLVFRSIQWLFFLRLYCVVSLDVELINSGPNVIGIPIFYKAVLQVPPDAGEGHLYRFIAEDRANPQYSYDSKFSNATTVTWNFTYHRAVTAHTSLLVYQKTSLFFPNKLVATNDTSVVITDHVEVSITPYQGSCHDVKDIEYVSTNCTTELIAHFNDPGGYITNHSTVDYFWIINDQSTYGPNSEPNISIDTSVEGIYNIGLVFSAYVDDGNFRVLNGYKSLPLHAKVPVSDVNVTGEMWLEHGALLDLTVDCKGSPPWRYCWNVIMGSYNKTDNESCDFPTVTTECHFYVSRYLHNISSYTVLVVLDNDVDHKVVAVTVNVYNVDRKPQLSTVIVPVTCSIIAVIFVVFGIGYFIQTRNRLAIEVADFDFNQQDADPQTFHQRLRSEFLEFWKDFTKKFSHKPQAYNQVD